MKRSPPKGGWFIDLVGGYKGEGKHTYKSKLLVTSHVRKMVVVVVVVVGWGMGSRALGAYATNKASCMSG